MINPGVVATIRVAGVRGDTYGAVSWTVLSIFMYFNMEINILD